jgi:hypothetical protein
MCTYTCGNGTFKAHISGTEEVLDTIAVKVYNVNSSFSGNPIETKYYYNDPENILLVEGKEYEIMTVADTFRITGIRFAEHHEAYILCADHCTVPATSVTVNGVTTKPSGGVRDLSIIDLH